MNRGGRPLHGVYEELGFIPVKVEHKNCAKCCECGVTVKNTARERLKAHRKVCSRTSAKAHELLLQPSHSSSSSTVHRSDSDMSIDIDDPPVPVASPSPSSSSTISAVSLMSFPSSPHEDNIYLESPATLSSTPSMAKRKITDFCDRMNAATKQDIDLALATAFYGCNIPFSVVESVHFKNFCQKMRPSYKPPTRKALSEKLLDEVYCGVTSSNIKAGTDSVLLIDGWKNESTNTKNVVTLIHNPCGTSGNESVFLEAFDMSGLPETSEALCNVVSESRKLAKERHNVNIYCTVSDNASNMVRMGKDHGLWHSACNAHTGNLLAKDLLSKNIVSRVNMVLKSFKHPDREHELTGYGGSKVCLAADTRWCSQRDACLSLTKNLSAMRKVAANDEAEKLPSSVKSLLYDSVFLKEVADTIAVLDPVSQLINQCQKEEATVADAVELWMDLRLPEDHKDLLPHLEKRKNQSLNIYSLAANVLHPVYQGLKLNEEHHGQVEEFILENLDPSGITSYQEYRVKSGKFGELMKKGIRSPRTFWYFAARQHKELSEAALKLLNIPASSAQLERLFSNWSFVHNITRNRLSFERSKKLLQIYYTLKLKDQTSVEY